MKLFCRVLLYVETYCIIVHKPVHKRNSENKAGNYAVFVEKVRIRPNLIRLLSSPFAEFFYSVFHLLYPFTVVFSGETLVSDKCVCNNAWRRMAYILLMCRQEAYD